MRLRWKFNRAKVRFARRLLLNTWFSVTILDQTQSVTTYGIQGGNIDAGRVIEKDVMWRNGAYRLRKGGVSESDNKRNTL